MAFSTNLTRRCIFCDSVIAHHNDDRCNNCRKAYDAGCREGTDIAETQLRGAVRGFARLRGIDVHTDSVDHVLAAIEDAVREQERRRVIAELHALRVHPAEQQLARLTRFLDHPYRPTAS